MRKIAAFVLAAAVSASAVSINAFANTSGNGDNKNTQNILLNIESLSENSYEKYLAEHSGANYPSESISISVDKFTGSGNSECSISTDANSFGMLYWQGTGTVSWDFEVDAEGLYCLEMSYYSQSENNSSVSFGINIDGEYPFDEAREVKFYRYWKNKTSIRLDADYKNQLLPELVRYDCNMTSFVRSNELSDEPLWFYLSRGEHTLKLYGVSTDFFIGSLKFCANTELVSYNKIRPTSEQLSETPSLIDGVPIMIEAEMPKYTNSAALRPTSETSDCSVSPSHPTYVRYNTIGADSWNTAGQTLFYEVSVPSEGYYALNIKCRMNTGSGLPLYRRISVNGTVPCEEFDEVEIPYSSDWQRISPRTKAGELVFVHLKAGKNVIAFEAINGEAGDALHKLENTVGEIINRIDSGEISGKFGYYRDEILSAKSALEDAAGRKINVSEVEVLANLLKRYEQDKPDDLSDLKKSLGSVCALIESSRKCSVEMDYFELRTIHEEFRVISRDFFKQLLFSLQRFWNSFFADSSAASEDGEGVEISVISDMAGAKIVNSLLGDYQDNVGVSEKSGSLLEMALSGNAPDVALFVDEDEVYELASRGLIVNLAALWEYETVGDLSPAGVSKLYEYNGGVYGVPLTNSFPMMFCRDDILSELGLSVPESWDDLEEILRVLKEHGLTAGLGSLSDTSAENMFMTMLSQSGQDFTSVSSLDLSEDYARSAFSRYTRFFTEYGCPREYDALRSFKTGRMPIVIADYSEFYGKLSETSEIRGLWSISHVPGTRRTDNNGRSVLDYSANTNSLGAVIFADSPNISKAWEFIQWFSQPEVQTRFGVMTEASSSEIYAPSNLTAVSSLRQSDSEYRKLSAQASKINEIPKSLSPALFNREVYSAFSDVLNGKSSVEEAISRYSSRINARISANIKK